MIYDTLARYYDALVKDDEAADSWVEWMKPWLNGRKILEAACGSGEITLKLADSGYELTAFDLSSQMVEQAAAKDPEGKIRFETANMLDLSRFDTYDAIICLCDSINYLSGLQELETFIKEAYNHLKPGGRLLFDTHSLDRLEEFALEFNETGEFEDGMQYQWSIMSEDETIYQDFAFYAPDGTMSVEHHLQKVFSPDDLAAVLTPYFDILDIQTDFNQPGIARGEKYFYVCARKEGKEL